MGELPPGTLRKGAAAAQKPAREVFVTQNGRWARKQIEGKLGHEHGLCQLYTLVQLEGGGWRLLDKI